jgi:hypothetical protein
MSEELDGYFFYSEKQKQVMENTKFVKLVTGDVVEYTECSLYPDASVMPSGKWNDYKFLGRGHIA